MAFIMSTKMMSISIATKANNSSSSFHSYESMNRRRRSHRLQISSAAAASGERKLEVGVEVLLWKGNKVLLGRRRTAVGYGEFALPGGHLEFGESFEECGRREVREETGIELGIGKLEMVTVTNNVIYEPEPLHLVTVVMSAAVEDRHAEPINLEVGKCDGWDWYDWNHLPSPLLPTLQNATISRILPPSH